MSEKVLLDDKYLSTDILKLFTELYSKYQVFVKNNPNTIVTYTITTDKNSSILHIKVIEKSNDTITN